MNALFTPPAPAGDVTLLARERLKIEDKRHLIQPCVFPTSPVHADLYLRKLEGEVFYGEALRTYGPAHLSFNAYFNSFYEAYWTRYTALETVGVVIAGAGRFWCSIFRESTTGVSLLARVLVELEPDQAPEVVIPVSLITKGYGHGGRLFVDLEAVTPLVLTRMAWTTTEHPLHEVALGVGICTFNREPFLMRTVRRLIEADPRAAVAKVVVTNQGAPLQSPEYRRMVKEAGDRLLVVEQANFGGAGGFARCAVEFLEEDDVTHVLFMDDDIDLDARHLVTTAAFLRYATAPVVLGGHMLDLFRRNILYEAGNTISPDNQLRPNHHNLDLNSLSSLTALSRAAPAHFNGWWYAAIPLSCFKTHGLPAPIFIRGDDVEFGVRLHRAGVETVALAPVSVWHEPFYAKAPGWQLYYDLRNRLILASFNDDLFGLESPVRLLKLLMVHLIRYDYQHAWFMQQAVLDFLKGPALVEEGSPAIHERITRGAAALAPAKMNAALGLDHVQPDAPDRPWPIRWRMLASFMRVLTGDIRRRPFGVRYTDRPLQWQRLGRGYVLSDREGHFFLRYQYSKAQTRRTLRDTAAAIGRYARGRRGASQSWKAAQADLVSLQSWRDLLGLASKSGQGRR